MPDSKPTEVKKPLPKIDTSPLQQHKQNPKIMQKICTKLKIYNHNSSTNIELSMDTVIRKARITNKGMPTTPPPKKKKTLLIIKAPFLCHILMPTNKQCRKMKMIGMRQISLQSDHFYHDTIHHHRHFYHHDSIQRLIIFGSVSTYSM